MDKGCINEFLRENQGYKITNYNIYNIYCDRLCGLVVRVLGYRSGTTRKKSSGSGTGSTQPREYN
jgi:hypothetical protein